MTVQPRTFASFAEAFEMAFTEEISGETFFAALAETEPDPRRADLWAKVALIEARMIAALQPVAEALGAVPSDLAAVRCSGREEAVEWQALPFAEVMAIMVRDYPVGYLAEFRAMLPVAPPGARAAVQLLIDHEIAIIDMARAELSGQDADVPLDAFLAGMSGWTKGDADGR